jgi:hypothetical protein
VHGASVTDDAIAGLEGQGARREVQPVAGVDGERDLASVGVDEPRGDVARRLQPRLEIAIGKQVRCGAFGVEGVENAARALGDRPARRVVEVDGVGGPGEFAGAQVLE